MKNYCDEIDKKQKFILGYEISEDKFDVEVTNRKIVIHLGNGKNYEVPWSVYNEENILQQIRRQMENFLEDDKIYNKTRFYTVLDSVSLPLGIYNMMHDPSVLVAILLFFIGTGILVNGSSFWEMRNNRKKYNYYFDNEKYINKNLFINENVFLGLNDEQIKLVKDKKKRYEDEEKESRNINGKTKDIFDVNMLDNFSLSDLKVLRANIEREMSLKIEYENDIKTYKKSI